MSASAPAADQRLREDAPGDRNFGARRARPWYPAALYTAILAASGCLALVARAEEKLAEIVVTGSAIAATLNEAPYSIDVLERDTLEEQGFPELVDLFKKFSANAGAIGELSSWLNGAGQAVPETVANVNLRGLGAARSLALFNGRRQVYVPARLTGGRFVDINAMPVIALDRIEVLKEGAGAVYGSDAIGGVVNFITRRYFKGLALSVSHEDYAGAGDSNFGAIWGGELGSAQVMVAAEHLRRQALNLTERAWGLPTDGSDYWGWSGVGNPGAFIVPDGLPDSGPMTLSRQLAEAPRFVDPSCVAAGGENRGNTCAFRFGPWDNFIEKQHQTRVFAEINGEWGRNSGFHLETLWSEAVIPDWLTTPSYPPLVHFDDVQQVDATHPGRVALAEAYRSLPGSDGAMIDLSGAEDWYFFGRLVGNSGPGRTVRRATRNFRLSGSVDGTIDVFPGHGLGYDLGLSWSRSEGTMSRPAIYAYRRFLAFRGFGGPDCGVVALASANNPSGLALGPIPAGIAPGQGKCLYYNPFSNAIEFSAQPDAAYTDTANPDYEPRLANAPELLAWLGEELKVDNTAELLVFDAVVDGHFYERRLNYAAGYQFRRFEARARPNEPGNLALNPCPLPGATDCANQTGLFTNIKGQRPYQAQQSTHAAFVELALEPHERWHAQLAARYEEHEQASSFDPRLALRWQLTERMALRGSVQTTFRTPSVDDLNEDIDVRLELLHATGVFKAIETQGNPELDPESAFTWNLGMQLRGPAGMELTLDYWDYDLRDPIGVLPFTAIETAYADPDTRAQVQELVFCPGNRNDGACSPTLIERVRVYNVNGPDIAASGVDIHIGGRHALGAGEFAWGADATRALKYTVDAFMFNGVELVAPLKAVGYLNDPVDGSAPPLPRWRAGGVAAYHRDTISLVGRFNHLSSYRDRARDVPDGRFAHIAAFNTLDLTLLWRLPRYGLTVSLSALNVTDEDPPRIASDHFFDGMTHDPKGRRLKLGLRYTFGD